MPASHQVYLVTPQALHELEVWAINKAHKAPKLDLNISRLFEVSEVQLDATASRKTLTWRYRKTLF